MLHLPYIKLLRLKKLRWEDSDMDNTIQMNLFEYFLDEEKFSIQDATNLVKNVKNIYEFYQPVLHVYSNKETNLFHC